MQAILRGSFCPPVYSTPSTHTHTPIPTNPRDDLFCHGLSFEDYVRRTHSAHSIFKTSMWYGTLIMYAYNCIPHLPLQKINVSGDLRSVSLCWEHTWAHIFSLPASLKLFRSLFFFFFCVKWNARYILLMQSTYLFVLHVYVEMKRASIVSHLWDDNDDVDVVAASLLFWQYNWRFLYCQSYFSIFMCNSICYTVFVCLTSVCLAVYLSIWMSTCLPVCLSFKFIFTWSLNIAESCNFMLR